MNAIQLDSFARAYIECALWSSHDNSDDSRGDSLDFNYSASDLTEAALARMTSECHQFQADNASDLELCGLSDEQAGHDFWLTRNRHGAGFWDRKHRSEAADKALDRLTEAAHAWGGQDLYVTDSGQIEIN